MFIEKLQTPLTVENAIIQLGDIDDSQKGRQFKSRFIQAGIAGYPKQFGNVLITKETLDKFVNTLVDKPVIINHKDEIKKEDEVGRVTKVWFNSEDGWFWCEGYLTDETAINLIKDKGWSVSCSYDVLLLDDEGGTENNIKYDKEFLNGRFTHLAIVENPRYERANIVVNSKTEIINNEDDDYEDIRRVHNDRWITVHPNGKGGDGEDGKGRHLLIKDGEDLKEAMQRQWGVYDKRQAKLKSDEPKVEKNEKKESKETYYDEDMEEYYTQDYVNSIKKDFDNFMKKAKETDKQPDKSETEQKQDEKTKVYTEDNYDEFHKKFYKEHDDKWTLQRTTKGYDVHRTNEQKNLEFNQDLKKEDLSDYLTNEVIKLRLPNIQKKNKEGKSEFFEDEKRLQFFKDNGYEPSDKYDDGYYTSFILKKKEQSTEQKQEEKKSDKKAHYAYDMPNGEKVQKLLDEKHKLEDEFDKSDDRSANIKRREEIDKEIDKLVAYADEIKKKEKPEDIETVRKEYEEEVLKQIEKHAGEKRKQRQEKQSDSPFGEGVEIIESDRKGMFLNSKNLKSFKKGEKFAILDDFSSEGRERYKVNFYNGKKQLESKTYSTKRGMEKAIREHLQEGANKETKALETKTSLEDAEAKYNEVLKRYNENDRKRWQSGLSNHEYYKAYDEAEKAKKELTTARREYAESIMANFEEQDNSAYTDKVDARRERFLGLSEQAQKASDAAHKRFSDMALAMPFGQPNVSARTISYRKKEGRAFDAAIREGKKADYYANKAASVGTAGISADDANAIAKLAQKYKSGVTSAEKRRIIDRVIDIHRNRQTASDTSKQTDYSNLGFQVERNADINRLQLKFNGKPDEKTRSILKSNGFRWSPREGAWQRQLNGNSEYGLKRVVEGLQKVDNSLTKGIKKIFNSYVPTAEDIPLLQGLIDIFEKNNK